MRNRIIAALSLVLGLACGGPAAEEPEEAQTAGMETPPVASMEERADAMRPSTDAGRVTEAELAAFADALIELTMLERQGAMRVQAGEPMADVQADLQPRADSVLEDSILTPQRFNEIAKRVAADAELAERAQRQLEMRIGAASL